MSHSIKQLICEGKCCGFGSRLEGNICIIPICPYTSICSSYLIFNVVRKEVTEPYDIRVFVPPGTCRTAIEAVNDDDATIENSISCELRGGVEGKHDD
jgi:hypothetical protein